MIYLIDTIEGIGSETFRVTVILMLFFLNEEGKFVGTSSDLNKWLEGKAATISSYLIREIVFYLKIQGILKTMPVAIMTVCDKCTCKC